MFFSLPKSGSPVDSLFPPLDRYLGSLCFFLFFPRRRKREDVPSFSLTLPPKVDRPRVLPFFQFFLRAWGRCSAAFPSARDRHRNSPPSFFSPAEAALFPPRPFSLPLSEQFPDDFKEKPSLFFSFHLPYPQGVGFSFFPFPSPLGTRR